MISNLIGLGLALVPLASAPIAQENVIYNDNSYSITLEIEEEENAYTYENFYNLLETNDRDFYETITVNGYVCNGYEEGNTSSEHLYIFGEENILFNNVDYHDVNAYHFFTGVSSNASLLNSDIVIVTSSSSAYNVIKTAIEQDISANQTEVMPSVTDLFGVIGQGITAFAGALGSAFNAVVALFWTSNGPTFVGLLLLVGIGAGLIYLTYRIISGLVKRLRG